MTLLNLDVEAFKGGGAHITIHSKAMIRPLMLDAAVSLLDVAKGGVGEGGPSFSLVGLLHHGRQSGYSIRKF